MTSVGGDEDVVSLSAAVVQGRLQNSKMLSELGPFPDVPSRTTVLQHDIDVGDCLLFCTDFCKVNNMTKPDSYPLPRMDDCIDKVGNVSYVTKLDLLKGYFHIPLTDHAKEISAFFMPDDFLQYTVMAFGMRNAPATFQRLVNIVLSSLYGCKAYLDDLVIYSDSWQSPGFSCPCFETRFVVFPWNGWLLQGVP